MAQIQNEAHRYKIILHVNLRYARYKAFQLDVHISSEYLKISIA